MRTYAQGLCDHVSTSNGAEETRTGDAGIDALRPDTGDWKRLQKRSQKNITYARLLIYACLSSSGCLVRKDAKLTSCSLLRAALLWDPLYTYYCSLLRFWQNYSGSGLTPLLLYLRNIEYNPTSQNLSPYSSDIVQKLLTADEPTLEISIAPAAPRSAV